MNLNEIGSGDGSREDISRMRRAVLVDAIFQQAAAKLEENDSGTAGTLAQALRRLMLFRDALPRLADVREAYALDCAESDETYTRTKEALRCNLVEYLGDEAAQTILTMVLEKNALAGILSITLGAEILDSARKDVPRALSNITESLNPRFEDGRLKLNHGKVLWGMDSAPQEYDSVRKQKQAYSSVRGYLSAFREYAREYLINLASEIRSSLGR